MLMIPIPLAGHALGPAVPAVGIPPPEEQRRSHPVVKAGGAAHPQWGGAGGEPCQEEGQASLFYLTL